MLFFSGVGGAWNSIGGATASFLVHKKEIETMRTIPEKKKKNDLHDMGVSKNRGMYPKMDGL